MYEVKDVVYYCVITALERYFGYVGDEWGNSLVIGEGLSVVGGDRFIC